MLDIIYMGTPEFSVPPLESIIEAGYNVKAVFTQPDRPVGRGLKLTPPPVKECAEKHGIPVYQPAKFKDSNATDIIKEIAPDAVVVAAYGQILPKEILYLPRLGCINIHASLLPALRGASPIQHAILNGDKLTGITTMQMDVGIDTGDILEQSEIAIDDVDDSQTLHDKLSLLGSKLIVSTLEKLEEGSITPRPQGENFTYAPLIKKSQGEINFDKTAAEIHNMVRAFTPWPSAFTSINGKRVKIFGTRLSSESTNKEAGTVISADGVISVACGGGTVLDITCLQPEGSKKMETAVFLLGHAIEKGTRFGG